MAQHDYVIANANGATVRADINNVLLAISSTNSGTSEPSTTYAYMLWLDSDNNLLKLRNAANDGWITLGLSITASNTVDINGGAIDGTPIGASSTSTGAFTTITASSTISGTSITASTSLLTPLIEYTDGDDAITIADGGGVTIADLTATTADINAGSIDNATVGSSTANTGAFTTLSASGATDLNSTLAISGNVSMDGSANELRFYEGANYVGFEAPALTGDQIWVLPTADGSADQVLKTDGSGNLSWATAGGGGASDIDDLSDCLVENNSMWLGNDPSSTTSTASYNVAVGITALDSITTADNTTAIGYNAGETWTTNGNNVALGYNAGETTGTTCTDGVWIGANVGSTEAIDGGKAGQVVIGASAQVGNHENTVAIGKSCPGQGNNTVTFGKSASSKVSINWDSGTAWSYPSDERMKENIADMPTSVGLSFINTLKPRTFTWRKVEDYDESLTSLGGTMKIPDDTSKKSDGTQYGFVAQEVKTAMEDAGITPDADGGGYGFWTQASVGTQQGVAKEDLIPSLVKAIQELSAKITALES